VTNPGLERAEVVVSAETNGKLTIDVERPGRNHQRPPTTEVFNLDRGIGRNGTWEPPDDLESHALTTIGHVFSP
jgi:hypothetical protein